MGKRPAGNPNWKEGVSGNPAGRPRVPEIQLVRDAIASTEIEKKKSLWKHLIERAFEDDGVLVAVAKKFLPDLSHDEGLKDAIRTFLVRADADGPK